MIARTAEEASLSAAEKVSDLVAEIAASSREQAQGIEQVNKAVSEMDRVTQQNAASSEESSSAAQEPSSQSEQLAAMVRTFDLGRGAGAPSPGAGPPGRPRAPSSHPGRGTPRHAPAAPA